MPHVETVIEAAFENLKALLGGRASVAAAVREQHSHDESYHTPAAPDIVCFPVSTDEVSAILKISAAHQVPGDSLRSRNFPRRPRQCDSRRHHHRSSRDEQGAACQRRGHGCTPSRPASPGLQLNKALRNTGVMFTVDPGADEFDRRHDCHSSVGAQRPCVTARCARTSWD